jgi:hypothetical protein
MFMSFLWHLESHLLVIHGEIRSKQEQEPKRRNWSKDRNLTKSEESCHIEQGSWHVARMWNSLIRYGNFVAR